MKNVTAFIKKTTLLLPIIFSVVSCGGGEDKGVPPTTKPPIIIPPAETVVSGIVMLGPVSNAQVTVYELSINKFSTRPTLAFTLLDTATQLTSSKGEYSVTIKPTAAKTPILVCATEGSYPEPASAELSAPIIKKFSTSDQLCAITIIKPKEQLTVNLTYFSHLAYGLAINFIANGSTLLDINRTNPQTGQPEIVLGGLSTANNKVSNWLQLTANQEIKKGVTSVTPVDITNYSILLNGNNGLTDEIKYGFANAAISDLVEWMRLTSPVSQNGTRYNNVSSIGLAQLAFRDISDGQLDGLDNATPLFVSNTAITGHMLRHHFAFKFFVIASNKQINRTGLNINDLDGFVTAINNNGGLFSSTPRINIFNDKPLFLHVYPKNNDIISGDVSIKIDAIARNNIASISMTMDTVPPIVGIPPVVDNKFAADTTKPEWKITTVSEITPTSSGIPDGVYDIKFVATDFQGISNSRTLTNIRISNRDIHTHIINPPEIATPVPAGPKNPTNKLANFNAVVNDVFFSENSGNSVVAFSIASSDPLSTFTPVPVPLQTPPFKIISPISRLYFASDIAVNNQQIIPDGKYKFVIKATSGKNVSPPLSALPEAVEFEYDTQIPLVDFVTPQFFVFSTPLATALATINLSLTDQARDGYMSGIKTSMLTHDALVVGGAEVSADIIGNQSFIAFGEQGWHQLTLNATDYAGNKAATKFLDVAYDVTPPTVQILNEADVSNNWHSKIDMTVKVDDLESGIFEIFSGLNITANTGKNSFTGDITNAPNVTNTFSIVDKDMQLDSNGQLIADGIYKYSVRASDFTNLPTNPFTKNVFNIGIDSTPPVITFLQENILNTAFSTTPAWQDVSTEGLAVNAITFDAANTSVTMNWPFGAKVDEQGYVAHTTPTSIAGIASGIATINISTEQTLENIASPGQLLVNKTRIVKMTNLPQYQIESSATVTEVWNVIATCPSRSPNGVMQLNTAGRACEEVVGGGTPQPRNTVYNWTNISSTIDATLTKDVKLTDTPKISTSAESSISITAMDRSSIPNVTGLSGNASKSFVCLNFRVSNSTTLLARTGLQIVADSGVGILLPTPGISTQSPAVAPIVCSEATTAAGSPPWNGTPLIPVLDSTLAFSTYSPTTAITCTINASSKGITTPAATTSTYKVELQLSPQTVVVDPASTAALVCPAVI